MNQVSDAQNFWNEQANTYGWHIVKTLALGLAAGVLGWFGDNSLFSARPILPMFNQNYGDWEGIYLLALLLIGLVWSLAVRRKIQQYLTCRENLQTQRRADADRERAARQAEERRLARAAAKAAEAERAAQLAAPKREKSSKFDY